MSFKCDKFNHVSTENLLKLIENIKKGISSYQKETYPDLKTLHIDLLDERMKDLKKKTSGRVSLEGEGLIEDASQCLDCIEKNIREIILKNDELEKNIESFNKNLDIIAERLKQCQNPLPQPRTK